MGYVLSLDRLQLDELSADRRHLLLADRVLTLNVQRVFTLTQKLTPLLEKSRGSAEGPWADPGPFLFSSTRSSSSTALTLSRPPCSQPVSS